MKFKPVVIIIAILIPAIFFAGCTSQEQAVPVQKHAEISYIGPLKSNDDYVGIQVLIVYTGDWQGSIIVRSTSGYRNHT